MIIMLEFLFFVSFFHNDFFTSAYNIDIDNAMIYSYNQSSNSRSSYFGYSVVIRPQASKYFRNDWVIQVGAPRANMSHVNAIEPGGLFRCNMNRQCWPYTIDKEVNFKNGNLSGNEVGIKNYSWLGVSMDVIDSKSHKLISVCGHRYANYVTVCHSIKDYSLIGICYVEDLSNTSHTKPIVLKPLQDTSRVNIKFSNSECVNDWGYGLAGFSNQFRKSGELIIGAPNIFSSLGSVVLYSDYKLAPVVPKIQKAPKNKKIKKDVFSFFGYSVSSGKFFDDNEWFVAGGPQSGNGTGRVITFKIITVSEKIDTIDIRQVLSGKSYGENFGAALAVVDLNNDLFDDLLVGAPMFSDGHIDQGRIYVFLSRPVKKKFTEPQIINGRASRGRFGSCICSLGDLDMDGHLDIAVGAPYEDDQGVIYIYRSGSDGKLTESQKIRAHDISPTLRGFGVSIGSGIDVDGNGYKDIVVGSYLSEQAVLLRSKPVVTVFGRINHPKFLKRDELSFNISFCFGFYGKYSPQKINVVGFSEVDGRGIFDSSGAERLNMEYTTVFASLQNCTNATIKLKKEAVKNNFSPLVISLNSSLAENPEPKLEDQLQEIYPIANNANRSYTTLVNIPFEGECGKDDVCDSKLKLSCFLVRNRSLRLGSDDISSIQVNVNNSGEPALATHLRVDVGLAMLQNRDKFCSTKDGIYDCTLGTLEPLDQKNMTFDISSSNVPRLADKSIIFKAVVKTESEDDYSDNICQLIIGVTSDASLVLTPSSPITIPLTDIDAIVNLTHAYDVKQEGLSPITDAVLEISIPSAYRGFSFSNLVFNPELDDACVITNLSDEVSLPAELRETDNISPLLLNCSSSGVSCKKIRCLWSESSFSKDLPLFLNFSLLGSFLKDKRIINFATNATSTAKNGLGEMLLSNSFTTSSIVLTAKASVDKLIIILSGVGGMLLLALLVAILLWNGFFRRKTKEKIEALKKEDLIKERFSWYDPNCPSQ